MTEAISAPADHSDTSGTRRERILIIIGIVMCALLGWAVLVVLARGHALTAEGYGAEGYSVLGPGMGMLGWVLQMLGADTLPTGFWGDVCRAFVLGSEPQSIGWPWQEAVLALIMWLVMALAMMLPTAAPFIATYGEITQSARQKDMQQPGVGVFITGYLIVWGAVAVIATGVQWGITSSSADIPVLINTAPIVGGVMLVLAGAYQWSEIKQACLSQCRSPMRFFMTYWRDGTLGTLVMGGRHGIYCVGCCWALMALMFVGGTMNLIWMAVLTVVMLLERLLPGGGGEAFGRFAGGTFMVWGLMLLVV